jgi:hypothetical protein
VKREKLKLFSSSIMGTRFTVVSTSSYLVFLLYQNKTIDL